MSRIVSRIFAKKQVGRCKCSQESHIYIRKSEHQSKHSYNPTLPWMAQPSHLCMGKPSKLHLELRFLLLKNFLQKTALPIHTAQKMKFSSKDFFSVFRGFANAWAVTPIEFAMLRNYKVKHSPIRDFTYRVSQQRGRGWVLSHSVRFTFFCIFGGSLFFSDKGEGVEFRYF